MYALTAGYGLNDTAKLAAFLQDPNPFVTLGQQRDAVAAAADRARRDRRASSAASWPSTTRPSASCSRWAATTCCPAASAGCTPAGTRRCAPSSRRRSSPSSIGLAVGAWLGPGATGLLRLHRRDRHRRHRPRVPRQQRRADPLLLAQAGAQRASPTSCCRSSASSPWPTRCTPWPAGPVLPVQPRALSSSWSGSSPASGCSCTTAPSLRRRSPPSARSSPRTTCRWTSSRRRC